MSTSPFSDNYVRTDDFESRIEGLYLPDDAWSVFAQLEQPLSVEEIGRRTGATPEAALATILTLVDKKIARKHLLNWREFLAQKGIPAGPSKMSPAGPSPAPATTLRPSAPAPTPAANSTSSLNHNAYPVTPPAARLPEPPAAPSRAAPTPAASITAEPAGSVSFSIVNESARRNRRASASMAILFRIDSTPRVVTEKKPAPQARTIETKPVSHARVAPATRVSPAVAAPINGDTMIGTERKSDLRKLRPLLEAITRKGGGGLSGQLLVYRVFLRVPAAMMYSAGIQSLSLVDDTVTINDTKFYDAIREAARSVAALDLDAVAV